MTKPDAPRRTPSRRTLVKGVTWATPVIATTIAAPAFALSRGKFDDGLFVTASRTDNSIGYLGANNPNNSATSDLNWNQSTGRPTPGAGAYSNGEGSSFTPLKNSVTGTPGSYASTSGFWWATPSQGGAHIRNSTATLKAGAQFTTRVTITFPSTTNNREVNTQWLLDHVYIDGAGNPATVNPKPDSHYWHPENTKTKANNLSQGNQGTGALGFQAVAGGFTFKRPTHSGTGTAQRTFTGELTFTTSADAKATDNGATHYGQAIIMPSLVGFFSQYGWIRFELTSWVTKAEIIYTIPGQSSVAPTILSNGALQTTTYIRQC